MHPLLKLKSKQSLVKSICWLDFHWLRICFMHSVFQKFIFEKETNKSRKKNSTSCAQNYFEKLKRLRGPTEAKTTAVVTKLMKTTYNHSLHCSKWCLKFRWNTLHSVADHSMHADILWFPKLLNFFTSTEFRRIHTIGKGHVSCLILY